MFALTTQNYLLWSNTFQNGMLVLIFVAQYAAWKRSR